MKERLPEGNIVFEIKYFLLCCVFWQKTFKINKKVENGQKKCFDLLSGVHRTQKRVEKHNTSPYSTLSNNEFILPLNKFTYFFLICRYDYSNFCWFGKYRHWYLLPFCLLYLSFLIFYLLKKEQFLLHNLK